jgi:hypothetical protein
MLNMRETSQFLLHPSVINLLKIGPLENKSGHPWCIYFRDEDKNRQNEVANGHQTQVQGRSQKFGLGVQLDIFGQIGP